MDMSTTRRQVLRPQLEDLDDLPAEDSADERNVTQDRRTLGEDDGEPVYAPSATPVRRLPPQVGAAKTTNGRGVVKERQGRPRDEGSKVRFDLDEDDGVELEGHERGHGRQSSVALIGAIQERSGIEPSERLAPSSAQGQGQSRFAALRRLDKDAGIDSAQQKKPAINGPASFKPGDGSAAADEEWLDEDGHPMSSFRKSRLVKQGLRPPSVRRRAPAPVAAVQGFKPAASLRATNGADEPMSALLQSISAENDAQVAAMSSQEVQRDLEDVREALGDHFLELLKSRSQRKRTSPDAQKPEDISSKAAKEATLRPLRKTAGPSKTTVLQMQTPQEIRQRYFRDEPAEMPSSLRWMDEQGSAASKNTLRFDFSGSVIHRDGADEEKTRSSGLHHHGNDQDEPGYSLDELLHLARSTTPGQRVIALQTLGRLCSAFPERAATSQASLQDDSVTRALKTSQIREKACTVASWYLEDRHLNVRAVALQCVLACFSSCATYVWIPVLVERRLEYSTPSKKDADSGAPAGPDIGTQDFVDLLVPSLFASAMLSDVVLADLEVLLATFCLVCQVSRKTCTQLVADKRLLPHLVGTSIKSRTWPTHDLQNAPMPSMLRLLSILVASSRDNALVLYRQKLFQPLPRMLSIASTPSQEQLSERASELLTQTLDVYANLALYGIAGDEYGRHFGLFSGMAEALYAFEAKQSSHSPFIPAALALLANWTLCATDAHVTLTPHDITWSQVSEWGDLALSVVTRIAQASDNSQNSAVLSSGGDAISLLDAWLRGARRKDQKTAATLTASLKRSEALIKLAAALDRESAWLDGGATSLENIIDVCRTGRALLSLSMVSEEDPDDITSIRKDLRTVAQRARNTIRNKHDTGNCTDEAYDGISRLAADFEQACMAGLSADENVRSNWLQLLKSLQRGDEELARTILTEELPRQGASEGTIKALAPFLHENVRPKTSAHLRPAYPSVAAIKTTDTLFFVCEDEARPTPDGESEEAGSGDNVDPMTGNVLWKSPVAGLPLRRDWPFCALDDLLHSGNCASLNRPDSLPSDWDANEAQIVEASLSLTEWLCESCFAGEVDAPTSAEIHMGIIKCLLLEEEQANNTRATGLITGRDLFRRPEIANLLRRLYSIALRPNTTSSHEHRDDLEKVTLRQYGPTRPFYQTYTDLVSVYDAVSFGDELFGRALLLPLTVHYAADYRRCLWIEHAHCLPTIVTTVADAPAPLSEYVGDAVETDDGLLGAYVSALLSGAVLSTRNELLYRIAIGHVARSIWTASSAPRDGEEQSTRQHGHVRQIVRAIFTDKAGAVVSDHVKSLRADIMSSPEAGSETDRDAHLRLLL